MKNTAKKNTAKKPKTRRAPKAPSVFAYISVKFGVGNSIEATLLNEVENVRSEIRRIYKNATEAVVTFADGGKVEFTWNDKMGIECRNGTKSYLGPKSE